MIFPRESEKVGEEDDDQISRQQQPQEEEEEEGATDPLRPWSLLRYSDTYIRC